MNQYGLIGYPLTHSFSKKYFEEKFEKEGISDSAYDLFPLQYIEQLPDLHNDNPTLRGLNVTIPYKEAVLPYLNKLNETAAVIGAVNCIKIDNKHLIGYNTDSFGFEVSLNQLLKHKPDIAFVLGTGGAAKAVWYVLKKLNISFIKVSNSGAEGSIAYVDIESQLQGGNLIINTTPLGTYPDVSTYPSFPYHAITSRDYLFDLVYNPAETIFLRKGKLQGGTTMNGLLMLEQQAEKSWEIWNSK